MQIIFWYCADIVEREQLEVCLKCGAKSILQFPNDGCMNCGAGLEFCVQFISKKQHQAEIEEINRLTKFFDSPKTQKELAEIARRYAKAVAKGMEEE